MATGPHKKAALPNLHLYGRQQLFGRPHGPFCGADMVPHWKNDNDLLLLLHDPKCIILEIPGKNGFGV